MDQILMSKDEGEILLENERFGFKIRFAALEQAKYNILYTDGLSKNDQTEVSGDVEFVYPRIELYFCLPKYWKLDQAEQQWPINWLDRIAQVPQKNQTWFGPGDTLPAGSERPPLAINENFKQNYFILSDPIALVDDDFPMHDKTVNYLAVIPIFEAEFAYKNSRSAYELFEKLKEKNHSECLDMYRKIIAKKKFFGLF